MKTSNFILALGIIFFALTASPAFANPQEPEAAETEGFGDPKDDAATPAPTADPDAAPEDVAPKTDKPVAVAPPVINPDIPEGEVIEEGDKWHEKKIARLQGTNKITAKTSEIKTDIGAKTKFGNLEILVEKCLRGPEDEKIENTGLFTIWDGIPGQERKQVFHGWMFSSSPALSALEHPIYDVILLGCENAPAANSSVTTPPKQDNVKPEAKKPEAKSPKVKKNTDAKI